MTAPKPSPLSATIAAALAAATALLFPAAAFAQSDNSDHADGFARHVMGRSTAKFASNEGNLLFLAAGTLYPFARHGFSDTRDQNRAIRTADTALTGVALSELLKRVAHVKRPDDSTSDSFPSGHATAAFAVANMAARYDRSTAPLWYAGATLISVSRVRLNRHRWADVGAGALLGIATGEIERRQRRGLVMAPIFGATLGRNERGADQPARGVSFTARF